MNYDELRTLVELQSLAFTVPLLLMCFVVVFEAYPSIRTTPPGTQMRWILYGICIGFFGNMVDNLYWMFPWTAHYLKLPITADLVEFGVFPNLIFRQFCTVVACYCHIRAFINPERKGLLISLNVLLLISVISGQAFIYILQQINN